MNANIAWCFSIWYFLEYYSKGVLIYVHLRAFVVIIIVLLRELFTPALADGVLLKFDAVVWMVSTCPLISNSFSSYTSPFGIVPSAPITIGITMFHVFCFCFCFVLFFLGWVVLLQCLDIYLSFGFLLILLCSLRGRQNPLFVRFSFLFLFIYLFFIFYFFLTITRSGWQIKIRRSVCISKSHRSLCVSFTGIDSKLCIYHLLIWSDFNFLNSSQWIASPT